MLCMICLEQTKMPVTIAGKDIILNNKRRKRNGTITMKMNTRKQLPFQQQQQQQRQRQQQTFVFCLLLFVLLLTLNYDTSCLLYTNRYSSVFVLSFAFQYQRRIIVKTSTNKPQQSLPTAKTSVPRRYRYKYHYYSSTDNTILISGRKSVLGMIDIDNNDNDTITSSILNNDDFQQQQLQQYIYVDSSINNTKIIDSYNDCNYYDDDKLDLIKIPSTAAEIPAATYPTNDVQVAKTTTTTTATAIVLLNIVAIIWGSQHAIIKLVINDTGDPSLFTFVRFAIAAISTTLFLFVSVPVLVSTEPSASASSSVVSSKATGINNNDLNLQLTDSDNDTNNNSNLINNSNNNNNEIQQLLRWGIEMGIWMFVGFSCQAIGLQYTTAQTSGFLLYLNVKFVPLLSYVLYKKHISISSWISAVLAFIGTLLLSNTITLFSSTGTSGTVSVPVVVDDLATAMANNNNLLGVIWSIAAAIASAMYIIRIEYASKAVTDSGKLNSISLWVVAILSLLWILYDNMNNNTIDTNTIQCSITSIQELLQDHLLEFLYLSIIATAVSNYIQTKVQTQISAERASIIYSMDPVYGAIFSYYILNETFTSIDNWFGTFLILLATTFNILYDFTNKKDSGEETKNI